MQSKMVELNLVPSGAARSSAHGASVIGGALRGPLTDADFRGCRWIEGDPTPVRHGMFCGSPVAPGESWCAEHHGVVFGLWVSREAETRPGWGRK
jgi:hypothetical protein